MNYLIIIGIMIIAIILIILGFIIENRTLMKPVKIEFKIFSSQIFLYAFVMFFCITMVMIVEFCIFYLLQNFVHSQDSILNIVVSLMNNGIIIAISLPIMSKFFGKWAKNIKLDLCGVYSAKIVKAYYSFSIVANCIWLLSLEKTFHDNLADDMIINRVIIWSISVFGTWWGIGYKCEGRVYEEIVNIINSKSTEKNKKKQIISPMIYAFCANCILLLIIRLGGDTVSYLLIDMYMCVFCMCTGALGSVLIYNRKFFPNKKKSREKLSKSISKLSVCRLISGRYENVSYTLERIEDKNYIEIQGREVEWNGHEDEVKKVYGEREKEEFSSYEECVKLLEQICEERRRFMSEATLRCDKELMDLLMKEKRELIG